MPEFPQWISFTSKNLSGESDGQSTKYIAKGLTRDSNDALDMQKNCSRHWEEALFTKLDEHRPRCSRAARGSAKV